MWLPWPSWIPPVVQFTLSLMLYDGLFSYTTVAFRALLADITTNPRERERCNAYAAVGHVVGSLGVGLGSFLYEAGSNDAATAAAAETSSSFFGFRCLTLVVALLSAFFFRLSSGKRYTETSLSPAGSPAGTPFSRLPWLLSWDCDRSFSGCLGFGLSETNWSLSLARMQLIIFSVVCALVKLAVKQCERQEGITLG